MAQQPLINGRKYSWASISVVVGSVIVDGIVAISYKKKVLKTNNFGRGSKAVDRTDGNEEYEGSITLRLYEVQRIQNGLPEGFDLTNVAPFSIPVSFADKDGGIINHRLDMVEFTEQGIDAKQNDPTVDVVLPLMIGDIKFN